MGIKSGQCILQEKITLAGGKGHQEVGEHETQRRQYLILLVLGRVRVSQN